METMQTQPAGQPGSHIAEGDHDNFAVTYDSDQRTLRGEAADRSKSPLKEDQVPNDYYSCKQEMIQSRPKQTNSEKQTKNGNQAQAPKNAVSETGNGGVNASENIFCPAENKTEYMRTIDEGKSMMKNLTHLIQDENISSYINESQLTNTVKMQQNIQKHTLNPAIIAQHPPTGQSQMSAEDTRAKIVTSKDNRKKKEGQ